MSKKLENIRKGHRLSVRNIKDALETTLVEHTKTDQTIKLHQYKKTLDDKLIVLKKLDEEILDKLDNEDDIVAEIEEAGKFTQIIYELQVKLDMTLSSSENSKSNEAASSSSKQTGNIATKLPKLVLKKFRGDATEWQSFWDSFRSAVHENGGLSKIDKFNYLKGLVEGTAESTISGLQLTEANYQAAIDLLERRFGDKQTIISGHMDYLLKISPLANDVNTNTLRRTYEQIETHVRGLKALDVPTSSYGALLVPVIVKKLPEDVKLSIGRQIKGPTWELDTLLTLLREEVENRERCAGVQASGQQTETNTKRFPFTAKRSGPSTASTLFSSGSTNTITCTYCRGEHSSANCSIVTDRGKRRQTLMKQGRCFRCLKKDHLSKDCTSGRVCAKCSGRHHISLCEQTSSNENRPANDTRGTFGTTHSQQSKESKPNSSSSHTFYASSCDSILLQTAQAIVETPMSNSGLRARVIFDSGSQRSYVTQHIKEHLNITTVKREPLMIKTFGSEDANDLKIFENVELIVKDVNGESSTFVQAFVVPTICPPLGSQEIDKAKRNFAYLENIELADSNDGESKIEIDILIGADFIWKFFTGTTIQGEVGGPVASETKLGWVLSGPMPSSRSEHLSSVNLVSTHVLRIQSTVLNNETEVNQDELVHKLWDLDSIGIRDTETVLESFSKNISFQDGRYNVRLPIKENHRPLPDNYELALSRLNSLVKRLKRDKDVYKEYNQIIEEQKQNGIIEKVDGNNRETVEENIHYLPHQAVIRKDAISTKLRVVYDASAKVDPSHPSLNDCIHTGPSLSSALLDILIRFRAHRIGLVADIEKAFLNISVENSQRDLMRFLWISDIDKEDPEVEIYRFNRVLFGMNCSPFLLNATLSHHIRSYYADNQDLAERVLNGFYVDDWTSGGNDDDETLLLHHSIKSCLTAGGFNLRKWASNSRELMKRITEVRINDTNTAECTPSVEKDNESYAKISVGGLHEIDPTQGEHKVLGVNWNLNSDTIIIKLERLTSFAEDLEINKRNILRLTLKLFDPLGLISPVMVPLKILFQELCVLKYDWDCSLSEGRKKKVEKWILNADKVKEIMVPRYYLHMPKQIDDEVKSATLHAFGDASKKAYCSVVYLCVETRCGYRHSSIVSSKSRLAPLSDLTIPRLELLAAVITARLVTAVLNALQSVLNIVRYFCWTDSKAVLFWITHGKELKQFVQNRVNTILELTTIDVWNHCPGIENPADIGSRGCMPSEIANNELWWEGPHWLKESPESYPRLEETIEECNVSDDCLKEFRVKSSNSDNQETTNCLLNYSAKDEHCTVNISEVIDCTRYSSILKLYRVTTLVVRFVKILKSKGEERKLLRNINISTEDLLIAEKLWIHDVQRGAEQQRNWNDLQLQLGLYKDECGVIRCRGRLANALLPDETKYPALLPRDHYFTKLIVEQCHTEVLHGGVKETLTQVRSRFWITRGRQLVKMILFKCVLCRRLRGTAYTSPKPSDLPRQRVTETLAFTNVGVDYAGPLYLKPSEMMPEFLKSYICLFTCSSSRALHLELAPDLSTESFIRCLRRFVARRGIPSSITSDNAKTFKLAEKELRKLFSHDTVQDFVLKKGIKWNFILEKAPWWGGFYERMVQLVKRSLRKILGDARLNYDELMTVLTEVEGTLNSRPLTYIDSDLDDQPLTPSHLVTGRRLATLPYPDNDIPEDDDTSSLTRRQMYLNTLLSHFMNRWKTEYLMSLREFHNLKRRSSKNKTAEVGDVVVIHDDSRSRSKWKTGVVEQLIVGDDKEVRGVKVRTLTNTGKISRLRRPVQKIYPLEVTSSREKQIQLEKEPDKARTTREERPQRKAKNQARERIKELVCDQAV